MRDECYQTDAEEVDVVAVIQTQMKRIEQELQ